MKIAPKNWSSFQHYKDRKPAWIKLHHELLDDYEFSRLPLASKALAPFLWLLASEYEGGEITASRAEIAYRLRLSEKELDAALNPLIESGFFNASEPLADRKQVAIPEKERETEIQEQKEGETDARARWPSDFREIFWDRYPEKVGRKVALAALEKVSRSDVPFDDVMSGLDRYIASKPPDRQWLNPLTWINQARWEDQPARKPENGKTGNGGGFAAVNLALAEGARDRADPELIEPAGGHEFRN